MRHGPWPGANGFWWQLTTKVRFCLTQSFLVNLNSIKKTSHRITVIIFIVNLTYINYSKFDQQINRMEIIRWSFHLKSRWYLASSVWNPTRSFNGTCRYRSRSRWMIYHYIAVFALQHWCTVDVWNSSPLTH